MVRAYRRRRCPNLSRRHSLMALLAFVPQAGTGNETLPNLGLIGDDVNVNIRRRGCPASALSGQNVGRRTEPVEVRQRLCAARNAPPKPPGAPERGESWCLASAWGMADFIASIGKR